MLTRIFDPLSKADAEWLRLLTMPGPRPNVLVDCSRPVLMPVVMRLAALSTGPVTVSQIPGELCLPRHGTGTVIVSDASALTLQQQIDLYDWLSDRGRTVQVITETSTPLWALVERGQFLEGLFHRLDVVHVCATVRALA